MNRYRGDVEKSASPLLPSGVDLRFAPPVTNECWG
jgi:hypothetical protein